MQKLEKVPNKLVKYRLMVENVTRNDRTEKARGCVLYSYCFDPAERSTQTAS